MQHLCRVGVNIVVDENDVHCCTSGVQMQRKPRDYAEVYGLALASCHPSSVCPTSYP